MNKPTTPATRPARRGAAPAFRQIRSARAFEEIAAQIRGELAAGRLQVGMRLPAERTLAEQFGVSRNTLREALRSLEHGGLIRLQKGASGGAFISERSGEAIVMGLMDLYHVGAIQPVQLTEARIWIESLVVREACRFATPEQLDALRRNVDEAEAAQRAGDFDRRAQRHFEFHRLLARMTGNPIMVVFMDSLMTVLSHFVKSIGDYDNAYVIPSRRRFLRHMEEGDVSAAVTEMEASLVRLQRSYLSRVGASAEGPGPARTATTTVDGARRARKLAAKAPARKVASKPQAAARKATASTDRTPARRAAARQSASPAGRRTAPRKAPPRR